MKYLACTTAISLAALIPVAADATTYTVPAGDSVTASASGTYDVVEVEGSLTVPSGVTLSGTANYIGRTSAATLAVPPSMSMSSVTLSTHSAYSVIV